MPVGRCVLCQTHNDELGTGTAGAKRRGLGGGEWGRRRAVSRGVVCFRRVILSA